MTGFEPGLNEVQLARKIAEATSNPESTRALYEQYNVHYDESGINYPTLVKNMVSDYARRLQSQGLSLEQYFMFTGLDLDKFKEQMRPGAQKRIESRLVLEAIVKAENFEVTDEEYEKELERIAEESKMEIDKLKEYIGDDEYGKNQITEDLKIQKAIDLIVENAKEK